jgi:putative redox protein
MNTSPELTPAATADNVAPGRLVTAIATGGQSFPADEPVAAGGTATGPGPFDLLCAALAACTAMTVRLYADHKAWPLEAIHVAVDHAKEADQTPPDVFHRAIRFDGPLDATQRERLFQIAERCPVHRTLTAGARIVTRA